LYGHDVRYAGEDEVRYVGEDFGVKANVRAEYCLWICGQAYILVGGGLVEFHEEAVKRCSHHGMR
jgi:hypothetical protein